MSSKSKSKSTQSTQQVSNTASLRNIAGPGVAGISGGSSVVINDLRGQALADSLNYARAAGADAFEFAGGATNRAFATSDASRRDALEFGAGAIQEINKSAELVADVSNAARLDALEFGAGALTTAVNQTSTAYQGASRAAAQSSAAAAKSIQNATNQAFEFTAGAFDKAFASIDTAADKVADFGQSAIADVAESTQSDASSAMNKIIILVGVISLASAAVFVARK